MSDALTILDCPLKMAQVCWPDIKIYDKQADILISLRDNKETFAHTGNEVGKSFIASVGAIWFFCSRLPVRVVTSSSGETQLKSILWSEIRKRIATSKVKLPIEIGADMSMKRIRADGTADELSYFIGHVTKSVENFQGHHLDHDAARILALFDECSGIDDEFYEAAQSWAHKILGLGNPLNVTNFFFRICKAGDQPYPKELNQTGLLRKVLHIDGKDSPNVILGEKLQAKGIPGPYPSIVPGVLSYEEYKIREHQWDDVKKTIRLDGHFYEGEGALLFPPDWLDLAEAEYKRLAGQARKPIAMGVDGGEGRDDTVWTLVDELGLCKQIVKKTRNTMIIPKDTIALIHEYKLQPGNVAMDMGGGGKEIADRLLELGYHVRGVYFGEQPTPPKGPPIRLKTKKEQAQRPKQAYLNRRAEMYGILRGLMNPHTESQKPFALPVENFMLRQELAILPLQYDSEGRLYLPPKNTPPVKRRGETGNEKIITLKQMLGRSPDRSDSLVLATFAMTAKYRASRAGALA